MQTLFQTIRMIAVVLWVGGLAFFSFVLAPIAFSRLPSPQLAGIVVGGTLSVLHWVGMICAIFFLISTAATRRRAAKRTQSNFLPQAVLMLVMLLATAYSQFHILPAMERDRALAKSDIESEPGRAPERADFNKLHGLSEKVEGMVLICGIAVVLLMSREHASQLAHPSRIASM